VKGLEFRGSSWALWGVPLEEYIRNDWVYFSNLVSFKVRDGSSFAFGMMFGAE
jgi:hypothetical protein